MCDFKAPKKNNDHVEYVNFNNENYVNDADIDAYFIYNPDSMMSKKEVKQENRISTTKHRDPLSLIDLMLTNYIGHQTIKAEALAAEISEKSKAVADINRLWGTLMTKNLGNVDPTKVDKFTNIADSPEYYEIDSIIKDILGEPKGISVITDRTMHNYDELQSANATITAFSDTIQVDLDATQQEFKNLMTAITSAQEEIRDVRRIVISFSDR